MPKKALTYRYILELVRSESYKISCDNGFYDWELRNDAIQQGLRLLCERMGMFWRGALTESQFLTGLHLYFDVVYRETEREWYAFRDRICGKPIESLPVDTVKLTARELNFVSERHQRWFFAEEGWSSFLVFDNDIGEQDYSHIELPKMDKSYRFTWGKYGKPYRQLTLGEVMEIDPNYLLWLDKNTDRFKLPEELKAEIQGGQIVHPRG